MTRIHLKPLEGLKNGRIMEVKKEQVTTNDAGININLDGKLYFIPYTSIIMVVQDA